MERLGNGKKRLVVGILAHVDAGKTTLCEGLLYLTGRIRKQGRVDHGDAFLDTYALEKARGITIFSKQAVIETDEASFTLIDTPGHVDFSAEAERTLQILDYAVLVISGTDGVQAHTETIWRLLTKCRVPTFVFINKMDASRLSPEELMNALQRRLNGACVDFTNIVSYNAAPKGAGGSEKTGTDGAEGRFDAFFESAALCSEELLDEYVRESRISDASIVRAIRARRLFPCFFGSALRLTGVDGLIRGLEKYTEESACGSEFGARVYKISRDAQGTRLTHIRITGGSLAVRTPLKYLSADGEELTEKAAQIRVYSGTRFEQLETAGAGMVAAVTGLTGTRPGQGLGCEGDAMAPLLTPVLNYRISLPEGCDPRTMFAKLRQLEEEEPQLHIVWNGQLREIHVQLMGDVQLEILKSLIKERFDVDVSIDDGSIMYRETIEGPVEGVGHFEPLRHYAEVHLLLEPLEQGSGLVFAADCSRNALDINWQRLILTHLYEKTHLGVLTGSPITDMKLTLVAGRASLSHTEGGDFRQATYRAVRQGLMKARSVLLEPYYEFSIELPSRQVGRAINDLRLMGGELSAPEGDGETSRLTGTAPVSAMRGYAAELAAYTGGRGKLSCSVCGYYKCQNAKAVIEKCGYDPESDLENTPDSVFCAHGAGFTVKWNEVESYMHLSGLKLGADAGGSAENAPGKLVSRNLDIDAKELESIMLREFGPIKRPEYGRPKFDAEKERTAAVPPAPVQKDYLIVDGYNIIFAWESLCGLAGTDIAAARKQLMDIMSNYCGYKKSEVLIVFDGYRVKGNAGERFNYHNVRVAYTKENETADMFIEKLITEIGKNYSVRVATSDGLIQLSSVRTGVLRMTAKELEAEVGGVNNELRRIMDELRIKNRASVKLGDAGSAKFKLGTQKPENE